MQSAVIFTALFYFLGENAEYKNFLKIYRKKRDFFLVGG